MLNAVLARKNMGEKWILLIISRHRGKIVGLLLGLTISSLWLTIGFWRTLFLIFFTGLGFLLGKFFDESRSLRRWVERILPSVSKE